MTASASRNDWLLGVALAVLLGVAWSIAAWPHLVALDLPDTDDVVRLQQVRDWLSGQRFGDLVQHRLGPAGVPMHWSRLGDLGPAALIVLFEPLAGRHAAEVAAVVLWPVALFALALALVGSVARQLNAPAATAIVVAALAYPATTLFLPGRIDHHGLQMVLLLVVMRALVAGGSLRGGVAAGIATAASLAIGLETAPLLAVAAAGMAWFWTRGGAAAEARLAGFGVATTLALAAAAALLRSEAWDYPACDGFTAQLWRAAQVASVAPLALALLGFVVRDARQRTVAALAIGALALVTAVLVSPGCLRPYGQVDPLLARVWLGNVGEAQPLLAAPTAQAIGYVGLGLAGALAALWRGRDPRWAALAAVQVAALALACIQLRGAYAAALLAAPALALVIAQARSRGVLALAGAWLVSAGLIYPLIGRVLPRPPAAPGAGCDRQAAIAALRTLPTGTVLAPIDLSAYALAGTGHRFLAGPYHRNNAGNLAAYRALGGGGSQGFDYLVWCGGFPELAGARLPAGLTPVLRQNGLVIFATPRARLRATGQVS